MVSPNRNNPNNTNKRTKKASNTNFDNDSQPNFDVKRPQMTSTDLVKPNTKSNKRYKCILKAGSTLENVEINGHYLDEILDNNDI